MGGSQDVLCPTVGDGSTAARWLSSAWTVPPSAVSPRLLLEAVLRQHKPLCCLWWEVLLLCFFPRCFVHYDKSNEVLLWKNWI